MSGSFPAVVSTVEVKRGDVGVYFHDVLTTGDAFDFTGATVTFILRPIGGDTPLEQVGSLDDATTPGRAEVSYTSVTGDLDDVGNNYQEWEIVKGGTRLTFPGKGYNVVRVVQDLNP